MTSDRRKIQAKHNRKAAAARSRQAEIRNERSEANPPGRGWVCECCVIDLCNRCRDFSRCKCAHANPQG